MVLLLGLQGLLWHSIEHSYNASLESSLASLDHFWEDHERTTALVGDARTARTRMGVEEEAVPVPQRNTVVIRRDTSIAHLFGFQYPLGFRQSVHLPEAE